MSVLRRQMFQKGAQQVMGEINQGIDNSQNFEQMINATRGDTAPIEDRYRELATIVGPEDAMQTPESVLTLAQPVIENALVDQGIGGLAQEQMSEAVTPDMTGGIMEMTQPVQQLQDGGPVGLRPVGYEPGGPVSLSDYYQKNLPIIQEILGSEDIKKQAQGQALLDIAQRAFLFGSGVNPATGQPYGADETEAQKVAGFLASATTSIGEQLAAYNKAKQAEKAKALDMAIAQKTAADEAASKTISVAAGTSVIRPDGTVLFTAKFKPEKPDLYNIRGADGTVLKTFAISTQQDAQELNNFVTNNPGSYPESIPSGLQPTSQQQAAKMLENAGYDPRTAAILAVVGVTDTMKNEEKIKLIMENLGISREEAAKIVLLPQPSALAEKVDILEKGGFSKRDAATLASVGWEPGMEKEKAVDALVAAGVDPQEAAKSVYGFKQPDYVLKMQTLIDNNVPKKDAAIIAITGSTTALDDDRKIQMLVESGVDKETATKAVLGFQQSDLAEKIELLKSAGYDEPKAIVMSIFGITEDMNNSDKIDRLVKYGNKTVEEATQIVLGGLPDKRYIKNAYGQVWEITDGKITQTYGDKQPNVQIFDNVLLDLNQLSPNGAPKILMTAKFDEVREYKGAIIRIKENDTGTLDVTNVYGDFDRPLTTIGRTVLDLNPNENGVIEPKIIYSDEAEDIRNVNGSVIKITDDGFETIYTAPDVRNVNGQLVKVTTAPDGKMTAQPIFGSVAGDGKNWFLPDTNTFVISYDGGQSYKTQDSVVTMPANAIKVDSTVAFKSAKSVERKAKAQTELSQTFPNGTFSPSVFYSVQNDPGVSPAPVFKSDLNQVTGAQTVQISGQDLELKAAGISGSEVQNVLRQAWADPMWAADKGIGFQATWWATFDKYVTGSLGLGMAAPEVSKAQQVLRSIIVLGRAAFVNNPRFPVYEMAQARELFADPDEWFGSSASAQSKLKLLKSLAVQRLQNNLRALAGGQFSDTDQEAMVTQNVEIKNLLYLLQTVPIGQPTIVSSAGKSFAVED